MRIELVQDGVRKPSSGSGWVGLYMKVLRRQHPRPGRQ